MCWGAKGFTRFAIRQMGWLISLFLACVHAEERLWVKASINGQPVRLAFDTGASDSLLFPKTAEKLGLSFTNPPPNVRLEVGESPVGRTEECELTLGANKIKTAFGVIEVPIVLAWDVDGVL